MGLARTVACALLPEGHSKRQGRQNLCALRIWSSAFLPCALSNEYGAATRWRAECSVISLAACERFVPQRTNGSLAKEADFDNGADRNELHKHAINSSTAHSDGV